MSRLSPEQLELQADEQRKRLIKLVEAADAFRHPRHDSKTTSLRTVAAASFAGLGVIGAIAALFTGRRANKGLLYASAAVGSVGVALGAGSVMGRSRPALPAGENTPLNELPAQTRRPLPIVQGPVQQKGWRRPGLWALGILLILIVAARIALNPVAEHFTRKGLQGLSGYEGTFSKVDVSIIPLVLTIEDLRLVQDGMPVEDAALFVKKLQAKANWTDVLRGRLFASARAEHAHFKTRFGETKAPPEVEKAAKEGQKEMERNDFDMSKTFDALIPFRVDRFEIADSEVTLIDATDPKKPRIWINDIEFVVENIPTREHLDQDAPLMITGRATVQKTGVLKVLVVADLLDDKPAVTGQAQLIGLNLESMYQWAASKAGLSPHGSLDVFVNFNTAKGALGGDVKAMAKKLDVDALDGKFSNTVKAAAANAAFNILKDEKKGESVATTLPIRGNLKKPDAQIWPTVLGVLRNAFVDSLNWGFGGIPVATAGKKEGVVEQTVKGLDKDQAGPKAQPGGK